MVLRLKHLLLLGPAKGSVVLAPTGTDPVRICRPAFRDVGFRRLHWFDEAGGRARLARIRVFPSLEGLTFLYHSTGKLVM